MVPSALVTPANLVAALLTLAPMLVAAFFPQRVGAWVEHLPKSVRVLSSIAFSIPYILVACAGGVFRC